MPLAIVAIPEETCYVWQLSSERIPHLTIMTLGDDFSEAEATGIADFLEHVANTSMFKFGLTVDRRDVLGPDETDVLLFKGRDVKLLEEVRSFLRTDRDIDRLFLSSPQFPEFIPHLTLGTSDAPAHPDLRDPPGVFWVRFDKVALWTGDFEGPTFLLKDQGEEALSMSDTVDEFLEHFGVRGMKWGVRNKSGTSTGGSSKKSSSKESTDHAEAASAIKKAKSGGSKALSNKELQAAITRMNLEQQYSRIAPQSGGRKAVSFGGKIAADILLGVGKSQAIKLLNDQASKLIAAALAK